MIQLARAYLLRKAAKASVQAERWDEAATRYDALRRTGRARPSDGVRHARALQSAGRREAALALQADNTALFPLSANVRRQHGLFLLESGDPAAAILALARALVLAGDDAVLEATLRAELERLGVDEDQAGVIALAAFHAEPTPRPAQPGRLEKLRARRMAGTAKTLRQAGDWARAAAVHEQVLTLVPHNAPIHIRQGHALKAMERFDEAERSYWKGLALAPRDADSYLQLGHGLKLNRGPTAALPAYLLAHGLKPGFQDLADLLADYDLSEPAISELAAMVSVADADDILEIPGRLTAALSGPAPTPIVAFNAAEPRRPPHPRPRPRHVEVLAAAIAGDIGRTVGASL